MLLFQQKAKKAHYHGMSARYFFFKNKNQYLILSETCTINGENQQLVTNELVEFEK